MNESSLSIIGAGKVGSSLASYFAFKGIHINAIVDSKESSALDTAEITGVGTASNDLQSIPSDEKAILICVPDGNIEALAHKLAATRTSFRDAIVFHSSGLRTSFDLSPLRSAGAITGSLHPVQSFPSRFFPSERLEGIGCGLEGSTEFLGFGRDLCERLGWQAVEIEADRKVLYHAACVFAGNFLTVLAAASGRILDGARHTIEDGSMDLLLPMMHSVLKELEKSRFQDVLTGPAARGDSEAIKSHLLALHEFHQPSELLYRVFAREALNMAENRKRPERTAASSPTGED